MASQFGNLPAGSAPFAPRPISPRGLYRSFGMPESLLRIHFPKKQDDPSTAQPWYWFYEKQQPYEFSFLAPGVWGRGWERLPDFSIIKILPIDSQELVPIPKLGATSLEDAARHAIPDQAFGRLDFRDQHIWDLVGGQAGVPKSKPPFNVVNGLFKARDSKTNINKIIKAAATAFKDDWNDLANTYNKLAAGVAPSGFHYPGQPSKYNFPLPKGPPTTVSHFQQELDAFVGGPPYTQGAAYIGPVPASAFFNINTFTTGAYAFTLTIGQLDPKKWNMSVFPPLEVAPNTVGNGSASAKSGNYAGFGKVPFPLAGPQDV